MDCSLLINFTNIFKKDIMELEVEGGFNDSMICELFHEMQAGHFEKYNALTEQIAKNIWNQHADNFNQWEELDIDEKNEMIKKIRNKYTNFLSNSIEMA